MSAGFLASKMLQAGAVRKFRLEWSWLARGEYTYAKTVWHGSDAKDCVERFVKAMPQAVNVRVLEEVR